MAVPSQYPDIPIPPTDIWSFLFQRPDRPFLNSQVILADVYSGRSFTFHDLQRRSLHVGHILRRRFGWHKGDVLSLVCGNSIDTPAIIWGVLAIGGIASPLNPNLPADQLAFYLQDSGAKAVVTQKAQYPAVLQACQKVGLATDRIIVIDDPTQASLFQCAASALPDAAAVAAHRPPVEDPQKEVAVLVYSSGTTGLPKGVMLSHTNIVINLLQLAAVDDGYLTHRDSALAFLPFFHIYGVTCLINSGLYLGLTTYVMPRFELETACRAIQDHRITYVYTVPPVILQFVQNPLVEQFDLSSLRLFNSAAAPLSVELIQALWEKRRIIVRQQYGMSECSPCLHSQVFHLSPLPIYFTLPYDSDHQTWQEGRDHPGSVGRLVANMQAKYVPIPGEEVRSDGKKEGELWVKGPNVFLGYLNNPQATHDSFSEDGYYKTGDVGYEDHRGSFVVTDRIKELIKYNGFQVAPAELENILLGHPAVADVAVVGIPSGQAGSELPRAYVQVAGPGLDTPTTAAGLVAFVKRRAGASYKELRGGVLFVDAIPRNPAGKILRRELKKKYAVSKM
ncbi:hypothetical protein ASPZODRAFT_143959 [Penicilliopsis zonata CBS 506.65]|uniref:AMP-dependent synthetase/ligase domain-containing protein n=1 Tax=Penicilliopsis zonata CBS 506.65 TaxID=1073090 RepID=A0A1L9SDV1_9EURO|nr:hypothetical protein ASPZODRAFT_143959 [Penicilliopsis zonata CBS 506.65]OJJ45318.1 hypothetical protein ASPZODRAFT_143959 [Penicilliopsis zonata CBS 506.65]